MGNCILMRKSTRPCLWLILFISLNISCGKNFLEVKSDRSFTTPSKISDFQALMDNMILMNYGAPNEMLLIGGEEFYITSEIWIGFPAAYNGLQQKNAYLWAEDIYEREKGVDWNKAYERILYCNLVLDGLSNMSPEQQEQSEFDEVKGIAHFHRAWNYYVLAQAFCKPYEESSSAVDLGLPLRIEPDVTLTLPRSSLRDLYGLIIQDLEESKELLSSRPLLKLRPSKGAALAMLSKVMMTMGRYEEARSYGYLSLEEQDSLVDFNTLDAEAIFPFSFDHGQSNPEIIFYTITNFISIMDDRRMHINDELLHLYAEDDLRPALYFMEGSAGNLHFKDINAATWAYFCGLSTPEVILLVAEAEVRLNNTQTGLNLIDKLLAHRYKEGNIPVYTENFGKKAILEMLFEERRRELAFRGVRWEDLRRLNKEQDFQKTLSREIDGQTHMLTPNSPRYVLPIPDIVIELSGIEQNKR